MEATNFENPKEDGSIEMVLIYEKKTLIKRFVNILTGSQLKVITNFGVVQNNSSFRTTQHPYKINFFFSTIVNDYKDELPTPLCGFNLVKLDDILSNRLDDKYLK
ncbi:Replication factor A protein 1, partial [Bienertia sinuspersici]